MTGRATYLARADAMEELDAAGNLASAAKQMSELREAIPSWGSAHRPDGPLAPAIGAALASCGLAPATLSNVTADTPAPASGEADLRTIKRQRATATLSNLTLPQVGALLAAWRQRQPAWAISAIDLAPDPSAPGSAAVARAGGDLPIRTTITMETLFVDRPTAGGQR